MININGRTVYDDRKIPLAKLEDHGTHVRVRRLPACSIGTFFAILNWLTDWGYRAV